jgi:2-iminoacetate synthase
VSTDEYHSWYRAGADGVTLYQETYDRMLYDELHLAGPKKDYDYRIQAPERVADAGFRQFSMGALLGLADWRRDVPALFAHLRYLEKKFPGVEYGVSFPRLRRVEGDEHYHFDVSDREMLKIICTARLLFPRAGINLSTRETAQFRDNILPFGITKISAGSLTSVGGYVNAEKNYQEGQFEVHDRRSFDEIKTMLVKKGYDPVVTDWRSILNE